MPRVLSISLALFFALSVSCLWSQETKTAEKKLSPASENKPKPKPTGDDYEPGPDSKKQPGVPAGKTFSFTFADSQVFPGTKRGITVYVPAQYKAEQPACVYVALDGLGFSAPTVFDNLIHKKEMPLVIGVGVSPGQVNSAAPPANPRFNRSMEFDGLNGNLARLILDEILPEVEKRKTPDGLPILLSKNPNDRCTGGGSTGGIGAFTLAWERPDAFRRVFTAIGTFVGMRGGDRYPVLIRKTEPKPLRVFMQDGENDQWGGGPEVGDWWNGNQGVQRALAFAGYSVRHVWGTGGHSGKHATAIFPDAMRWLWKDWPSPVEAGVSQNHFLKDILLPGEDWQVAASEKSWCESLTSDQQGNVFFQARQGADIRETIGTSPKTFKISEDGKVSEHADLRNSADIQNSIGAMAFGPDGRLYVAGIDENITAIDSAGKATTIAENIRCRNLAVTHTGNIYATEFDDDKLKLGKVWLIRPTGEKVMLDDNLICPTAIALSPDGLWLAVAEYGTHWGYSYQVKPDGTVQDKQQFYWFHVPDTADDSGAHAWCMDRDGRLYAATHMGVQVFDRNGRVRCILPVPGRLVTGLCFGGPKFDVLYVSCADNLLKRKLKVPGAPAWLAPIKLPPWGGG